NWSDLLSTIQVGPDRPSQSSSWVLVQPILASTTSKPKSAERQRDQAASIPCCSIDSSDARMPAVSVITNGQLLTTIVASTVSRVVPGWSCTSTRRVPHSALTRLLLPTFGGPASVTRHGSSSLQPNAQRSISRSQRIVAS